MSLSFASEMVDPEEFRRRRETALRSGNPAWLWPEVSVSEWAEAMRNVSSAASAVLAGTAAELVSCEPLALSLACYTSGLGPLLGWWAEQGLLSVSAQTRELLAIHLQQARDRTTAVEDRSRKVVSAIAESGVPVIVLKGGHTAHAYFPDPAARPASDLDLLVPTDRAEDAEAALSNAGLHCIARNARESSWGTIGSNRKPRHLWLVGGDDPWSVDLHRSLDFSAGAGARLVNFDSADPFAGGQPWALGQAAATLRQPLLLLNLAVHASGGLHSLTLLRMVEIILVVRRDVANQRLAWDEFMRLGARIHGLGAAYPALSMSEKLAPGTIPSSVLRLSRELAPDRARRVVDKLEPANVQRIDRASIAEHFMWVEGPSSWGRQLWSDLISSNGSIQSRRSIYQARAYRLLRGAITP
jgi:hypothetical protein